MVDWKINESDLSTTWLSTMRHGVTKMNVICYYVDVCFYFGYGYDSRSTLSYYYDSNYG